MYIPDNLQTCMRVSKLNIRGVLILFGAVFILLSCSFDYSAISESEQEKPDLVMQDVDYAG